MRGRFMEHVLKLDNISLDDYILGIADGNTKYLEKLYGATKAYVFGYAFSILKNINDSEDVMQDVFLNIYKNAQFYSSKNKPMAWIITITRNLCLEKIRRKNKLAFDDISTVEHLLSKKDVSYDKVLLKTILEELSDEERQIVVLNSLCGFTFLEISRMLELKLSTVLSKYNRAIKKVRSKYKEAINE
jgi:RNA polymerase sigma-70 factor (ECF subfamily)